MHRPIVILGGMGPQASLRFQELLIQKSESYHNGNGDEYPFIVHFSLPVIDFISDESAKQDAITTISRLTRPIEALKPQQITLACNTAHLLIPDIPLLQNARFKSLIEATAQVIADDGIKKIGLLGSPTTIRSGLYTAALNTRGVSVISPNVRQQKALEQCIRAVIAGSAQSTDAEALLDIAMSLVKQGAQAIVLGCTELPLLFPKKESPAPYYDTLEVYAQAVIDRYYSV